MFHFTGRFLFIFSFAVTLISCHSSNTTQNQDTSSANADKPADITEYQQFRDIFQSASLPFTLPPSESQNKSAKEIDKKYIKELLTQKFTLALSEDDGLPALTDNMDAVKYFAEARLKLDSFDGYIIHKQNNDDYYYL